MLGSWYNSLFSTGLVYVVRGGNSFFNNLVLLFVLFCFLSLRAPYFYGMFGLYIYLLVVILPLFLSLFFSRCLPKVSLFFAGFVPSGTPLAIVPFVCLAETISYIVRPVVLLLRPFVNLSLGAVVMFSLSSLVLIHPSLLLPVCAVFFYEVFVALVHWFIVCNILSFSVDH